MTIQSGAGSGTHAGTGKVKQPVNYAAAAANGAADACAGLQKAVVGTGVAAGACRNNLISVIELDLIRFWLYIHLFHDSFLL